MQKPKETGCRIAEKRKQEKQKLNLKCGKIESRRKKKWEKQKNVEKRKQQKEIMEKASLKIMDVFGEQLKKPEMLRVSGG